MDTRYRRSLSLGGGGGVAGMALEEDEGGGVRSGLWEPLWGPGCARGWWCLGDGGLFEYPLLLRRRRLMSQSAARSTMTAKTQHIPRAALAPWLNPPGLDGTFGAATTGAYEAAAPVDAVTVAESREVGFAGAGDSLRVDDGQLGILLDEKGLGCAGSTKEGGFPHGSAGGPGS